MKEICLSLFVTVVALAMIFVLDMIADLDVTGDAIDLAVRAVIKAIAVLIGFSWEKAFDFAVEDVAKELSFLDHSITKLLLAVLLALTVVPAWRWYILPTILELEELEKWEQEKKRLESGAESEQVHRRGLAAVVHREKEKT